MNVDSSMPRYDLVRIIYDKWSNESSGNMGADKMAYTNGAIQLNWSIRAHNDVSLSLAQASKHPFFKFRLALGNTPRPVHSS